MTLDEFELALAATIGRPSLLRPFVCEGNPLNCGLFIVGYNPATSLPEDWWRFWASGYGYKKGLWSEHYLATRGAMSKSRGKIEEIVSALPDIHILEANIDARPSKRKSEYPRPLTAPFDLLLKTIKPKVILAHGVDAVRHLAGWEGTLIESPHFIYVGREKTNELISRIKLALIN